MRGLVTRRAFAAGELRQKVLGIEAVRHLIGADRGPARGQQIAELAPAGLGRDLAGCPHLEAADETGGEAHRAAGQRSRSARRAHPLGQIDEAVVAAEQLVAPRAGQRHGEAGLPHEAAHEVGVDAVEGRLIEAGQRAGEVAAKPLLREAQLEVLGAERLRDPSGIARLVEGSLLEPDMERLDATPARANGQRRDGARIDSTREEDAQRDVAEEMLFGRAEERLLEAVDRLLPRQRRPSTERPVSRRARVRWSSATRIISPGPSSEIPAAAVPGPTTKPFHMNVARARGSSLRDRSPVASSARSSEAKSRTAPPGRWTVA